MKLNIEDTIPVPVSEVYDAVVDPQRLANHFVDSASGAIIEGHYVNWNFGKSGQVDVRFTHVEKERVIEFSWPATGLTTYVQIQFEPLSASLTKIIITESEWKLDKDSVATAVVQTQGWTAFIDGLKAYLLFNINLREGKKL